MTFEVDVDGRVRTIAVERAGAQRFRVIIDGDAAHPRVVDAARVGEFGLSLLLDPEGVASREVQIAPGAARGELLVELDGRMVAVTLNGRRTRRRGGEAAGAGKGEQSITAPMPGRVVRVLVGPGDAVAARQPLVVVEAMKMENELRAPRAGTVKEVTVSAGNSVEAGRVLVTIV